MVGRALDSIAKDLVRMVMSTTSSLGCLFGCIPSHFLFFVVLAAMTGMEFSKRLEVDSSLARFSDIPNDCTACLGNQTKLKLHNESTRCVASRYRVCHTKRRCHCSEHHFLTLSRFSFLLSRKAARFQATE